MSEMKGNPNRSCSIRKVIPARRAAGSQLCADVSLNVMMMAPFRSLKISE